MCHFIFVLSVFSGDYRQNTKAPTTALSRENLKLLINAPSPTVLITWIGTLTENGNQMRDVIVSYTEGIIINE